MNGYRERRDKDSRRRDEHGTIYTTRKQMCKTIIHNLSDLTKPHGFQRCHCRLVARCSVRDLGAVCSRSRITSVGRRMQDGARRAQQWLFSAAARAFAFRRLSCGEPSKGSDLRSPPSHKRTLRQTGQGRDKTYSDHLRPSEWVAIWQRARCVIGRLEGFQT